MATIPFGLPNTTRNPEGDYHSKSTPKTPFPGSRASNVTTDPERDTHTNVAPPLFPTSRPATVSTDKLRDADTAQSNNTTRGGSYGASGTHGYGAVSPEAVQGSRTYTDPNPTPTDRAGRNTPEQAGRSGQKNADYLPVSVPDDPEHGQPSDANLKPGAPTSVVATAGVKQASVAFTAPTGGPKVTRYLVTSTPGGVTVAGATSPIVVPGLTTGTGYTFTVTADSQNGQGAASTASSSVTPT